MDVQTSLLGLTMRSGSASAQSLIHTEIPLPEGRSAETVLVSHCRAAVESAECRAGTIHVTGRLELYIVCRAVSGEPFGFSAMSTFSHVVDCGGAAEGMTGEAAAQVLECGVKPEGGQLKLTAVLEIFAFATAPVTTPFVTDVLPQGCVETRRSTLRVKRRELLAETTFRIREEADANGVSRVLLYDAATDVSRVSYTGASSCELEGVLHVTVLAETQSQKLETFALTIPFRCPMEAGYLSAVWGECTVDSLSVLAADVSFGVLDVEASLGIHLYGIEECEHAVLLDAYGVEAPMVCRHATVPRLNCAGAQQKTFSLRETVLIPQSSGGVALPDAVRGIYAAAMPVVTGLYERNGMLGADVMLLTSVLYEDGEGRLRGFTEDIPAQLDFEAAFTPEAQILLRPLCVQVSGSGRSLSLGYLLFGEAVLHETAETTLALSLEPEGEPCPYQGILLYCADEGETLWDVGKRFLTPLSDLSGWNGELPEYLPEGQPVMILK